MDYFASDELYRINLKEFDGSDNWVDIKDELTDADKRALQAAVLATNIHLTGGDGPVTSTMLDLSGYYEALLTRAIKAWSFVSPTSKQPIPPTKAWILKLRKVGEYIAQQADAHYKEDLMPATAETEADRKNGSGPASPPTEDAGRSPSSSPIASSPSGQESTPTQHPVFASKLVSAS